MSRFKCLASLLIAVFAGCQVIGDQQSNSAGLVRRVATQRVVPEAANVTGDAQSNSDQPQVAANAHPPADGSTATAGRGGTSGESAHQPQRMDRAEVSNIARMLTQLIEQDNPQAVAARKNEFGLSDHLDGEDIAQMLSSLVEEEPAGQLLASSPAMADKSLYETRPETAAAGSSAVRSPERFQLASAASGQVVGANYEESTENNAFLPNQRSEDRAAPSRTFANFQLETATLNNDQAAEQIAQLTAELAAMIESLREIKQSSGTAQAVDANIRQQPPQSLVASAAGLSANGEIAAIGPDTQSMRPNGQGESNIARRVPFGRGQDEVNVSPSPPNEAGN